MPKVKSTRRTKRVLRHRRVRKKIYGTKARPRLSVFKSNQHIYAQAIDDDAGRTLLAVSDSEVKSKLKTKVEIARATGRLFAEKLKEEKVKEVVFDRGGFKFHGRVKAFAEGLKEGGLKV
jgi:large subunit ribosomal protein L18